MLAFTGKYGTGCLYFNNCVCDLESFLYLKLYDTMILVNAAGLAGGIYRRYLPPVFTGKYRRGQYSQKWSLPAFTGIYKYFINFSSNYIVDSPSYLLYYTWTP